MTKKSLTPAELFDHRLAALLGRTVEEMYATMTASAYQRWQLYWKAEPWGPWRDNLHAALIAREVRRPQLRKGARVEVESFMVRDPGDRQRDANQRFVGMLMTMAKVQEKPHD